MCHRRPAHFAALHFEVGDRRVQRRIPVHQPPVAIDQPLVIEADEHFAHRRRQALVEREPLARPVERGAEPAELLGDRAAGFRAPPPHAGDERLTAEAAPVLVALLSQKPLDNHLGRDPGMVGARLPERIAALHPAPADQHVLDRERQRMAHVQAAGDVRRRDHDGERRGGGGRVGGERARLLPAGIKPRLALARCENLVQHGAGYRAGGCGAQAAARSWPPWIGMRSCWPDSTSV